MFIIKFIKYREILLYRTFLKIFFEDKPYSDMIYVKTEKLSAAYCQFRGFTEVKLLKKLHVSPNREVFKFLIILSLLGDLLFFIFIFITLNHSYLLLQSFFVNLFYIGIVLMAL